jgi:hypothetical protein
MSERPADTRRGVLKKLGAGAFLPLSSLANKQTEIEKLPDLMNQEGVVKWLEVPKQWAEQKRQAVTVCDNLAQRFSDEPGVVETGLIAAPEEYGGKRGLQVEIVVDSDQLKTEIPDHVDGVQVVTDERNEPLAPLCVNETYDNLPGGVAIWDGDGFRGTSGWKVEYNGTDCMMTANHVAGTDDIYGDNDLYGLEQVGTVIARESSSTLDAAAIDGDRSIPNKIIGESTTYPIGGWVHEDGICSRAGDWYDGYRKIGSTSGKSEGGIGKCHVDDSYHLDTPSFGGHGVKGGAMAARGDSGGPAFSLHDGDAYITHMITHGDPKVDSYKDTYCGESKDTWNKSLGTAGYHLNDQGYKIIGSSRS